MLLEKIFLSQPGHFWSHHPLAVVAAAAQLLNFLLIAFVTPESNPAAVRAGRTLDLRTANPLGALRVLFGRSPLMRGSAAAYFFVWLANTGRAIHT